MLRIACCSCGGTLYFLKYVAKSLGSSFAYFFNRPGILLIFDCRKAGSKGAFVFGLIRFTLNTAAILIAQGF